MLLWKITHTCELGLSTNYERKDKYIIDLDASKVIFIVKTSMRPVFMVIVGSDTIKGTFERVGL